VVIMGGTAEAHGETWKRVPDMGECQRGTKPIARAALKGFVVTADTKPVDLWEFFLPVPLEGMPVVVRANAALHPKDKAEYCNMGGLRAFLGLLFSGAQFKVGTDLWSKKRKGMMPALNYSHVMSKGKFDRYFRYLSEGPPDDIDPQEPLYPMRWVVGGFNKSRKAKITAGTNLIMDESMWQWLSGNFPALSYIQRKPEPYGMEMKNLMCGDMMAILHMEMQEGKVRM
jgi:hypothetical protein